MDKANHTLLDSGGWGDWMAPNGNPDGAQLSARDSGSGGGGGTCGGSYEYISALTRVQAGEKGTLDHTPQHGTNVYYIKGLIRSLTSKPRVDAVLS